MDVGVDQTFAPIDFLSAPGRSPPGVRVCRAKTSIAEHNFEINTFERCRCSAGAGAVRSETICVFDKGFCVQLMIRKAKQWN